MYKSRGKGMSFSFGNNNINQFRAQSAYKDGSGMGGGGMYMRQGKKKKEEEEDIFEYSKDSKGDENVFDVEIKEQDIDSDTLFNKFVNWFKLKKG